MFPTDNKDPSGSGLTATYEKSKKGQAMWRLHRKNVRLTLSEIRSERIFLVIRRKGMRLMSTDGHFSRFLHTQGVFNSPQNDPAICLLATKPELLNIDLLFLHESLLNAGVLTHHLPIPVSLAIYDRKIDILGSRVEDAINEIKMALETAGTRRETENFHRPRGSGYEMHKRSMAKRCN